MPQKTYTEQLIEELVTLPEEMKKTVSVHLLGTIRGIKMADTLNKDKKSA